jgi:hypothetical protein
MDRGFALAVFGLWALGAWFAASSALGRGETVLLTLSGLPLVALLLGTGRSLPRPVGEGVALVTPVAMLWLLNYRALDFWWMNDDPCLLLVTANEGLWHPFFTPVGNFLQPLQTLSLGIDLQLFGLEPRIFYVHQLLAFTVLLGIGHGFLRGYLGPAAASLALTLFVASPPAIGVAQQLMNRHYLEGLALILASFACYRRAVGHRRRWLAAAGAGLYLLATASKEVFVPMLLCLPFLAGGDPSIGGPISWRERLRITWRYGRLYGLVLASYLVWRLAMLGWSKGMVAYGDLSGGLQGAIALRRGLRILGLDEPWKVLAGGALLIAATWILGRRSTVFAAGFGATLVTLAVPLIPIAGRLEPRHLLLAAFAASAVIAAAVDARSEASGTFWCRRSRTLAGAALAVLALATLVHAPAWTDLEKSSRRHRTEGSFLLDDSRGGMLLSRLSHSHFLACLSQLSRDVQGHESGPGFCGDHCFCAHAFPGTAFWETDGDHIVPVIRTPAEGCDASRPLAIDLGHDRRRGLTWQLEPMDGGSYQALLISDVLAPGVSAPISIPRQGSLPYQLEEPLRFVIRYRSPEGWRTYSPIYVVEPGGRARREAP